MFRRATRRSRSTTSYDTEEGYDYAYVQVSADGGRTYESIPCTDTVSGPLGPA